jgi:isohexenylglutaconyl-CoA hydratase
MLTAARFDGKDAQKIGLADFIFDDESEVKEIENKLKSQILKCAPGAIAQTKELVNSFAIKVDKDFIDLASKNFADQILDGEGKEGISSFIEKRKPKWQK